jgi:hypothetical protein
LRMQRAVRNWRNAKLPSKPLAYPSGESAHGRPEQNFARHLVRALYYAMDGKPVDAIAHAVDRGWMLLEGSHSVCLIDAGRDLVEGR